MSGTSDCEDCPRCGKANALYTYYDWKPHQMVSGVCLECGYKYYTELSTEDKYNLEEFREAVGYRAIELTDEMKERIKKYDEAYCIGE